jgi:predicted Fe-Mo cluster-binding NifX family protein
MNVLEEQALVDDLRRRGDHRVRAASLSCTVEQYRAAARKVGRKHGWRIRTFLVDGGAGIIVVWADREQTDLEQRAVMVAMSTGRSYDEVLEEVRRQNLKPVDPQ